MTTFNARPSTGNVTIIDIVGRLTLGDPVTAFTELLPPAADGGPARLILNFDGVDYIDSAGLATLLAAGKTHSIKLINLPRRVIDLLRLTGTYSLFDVQPNEQAAIMKFQ